MRRLLLLLLLLLPTMVSAKTFPATSDPTLSAQQRWGAALQGYLTSGCLHGTSVSTTVSVPACRGFAFDTADPQTLKGLEETVARNVTFSGGDGTYWLVARWNINQTPGGWTCVAGTHYCWLLSVTEPAFPSGTTPLTQSTVAAGAVTAVLDIATRRFVAPTTFTQPVTTGPQSVWIFEPGARLTYTGQALVHSGATIADPGQQIFFSGGTGTLKFGAGTGGSRTVISPAWFAHAGSGSQATPWTSTDNCGGWCEAMKAVQFEGNLKAAPGYYRFSSATAAGTDLAVNSGDGNIRLDLTGAVIQVTAPATTVLDLNPNGTPTGTNTNLNTVHITGGMITTQLAGVSPGDAPILGIGIDGTRVRMLTIEKMRFLGLTTAILGDVADTFTVRENFFRRVKNCVLFTDDPTRVDVSQDIYIENNTASITNGGAEPTALNGSAFVRADGRTVNLVIRHNGIANSTENSWFVKLMTGGTNGDSEELTIEDNATEQFAGGSKLIEIDRFGTTEFLNVSIVSNQLGGALDSTGVPPFANGQPAVDLEFIANSFTFTDNECPNTAITCLRLDNYRNSDTTGTGTVAASGLIANNTMRQVTDNNGKPFNITNVLGNQTTLRIGHNAMVPFYDANMLAAAFVYPDTRVVFDTSPLYTSNRVAAATMTFSPWDNYVEINGMTIITAINPTWDGHRLCLLFETENGGIDGNAGLFLAGDFRARVPNESNICLHYDGKVDRWIELSRTNEVLQFSVTSSASLVIPEYPRLVNVDGSATITSINVPRHGVSVAFRCVPGSTWGMTDGSNLFLNGNFTCTDNDVITLIPNNTDWFEQARSTN